MKRNVLAALVCALAVPAAALAAGTSERTVGKKHMVVAQSSQTKKEPVTPSSSSGSVAKKSGKKVGHKSGKARSRTTQAPKAGDAIKSDSSAK